MGQNQSQASNLPTAVFDHFGKATVLHGYVLDNLQTAAQYAYEAGKELLAAKQLVPHGRWAEECARHFAPSLKTAQRYMALTKHVDLLPKTTKCQIFYLESTIDGATKAAKNLATGKPPYETTRGGGDSGRQQKPDSSGLEPTSGAPDTLDAPPPPSIPGQLPTEPPEPPQNASDDEGAVDTPQEPAKPSKGKQTPELDDAALAKKNKQLAHSYRDKLARAVCDYHEVAPNRAERDRLVKLVQGVELW